MYPCYLTKSIEDNVDPKMDMTEFSSAMSKIQTLNYKCLLKQMIMIQEFALNYFKDLNDDINSVAMHFLNISDHLEDVKKNAPSKIENLKNTTSYSLFKLPEKTIQLEDKESLFDVKNNNLRKLIPDPAEDISLDFISKNPNIKDVNEVRVRLTNPDYFRVQLYKEYQDKILEEEPKENIKSQRVAKKKLPTKESSHLNTIISNVKTSRQEIVLATPPSIGDKNWRQRVLDAAKRKQEIRPENIKTVISNEENETLHTAVDVKTNYTPGASNIAFIENNKNKTSGFSFLKNKEIERKQRIEIDGENQTCGKYRKPPPQAEPETELAAFVPPPPPPPPPPKENPSVSNAPKVKIPAQSISMGDEIKEKLNNLKKVDDNLIKKAEPLDPNSGFIMEILQRGILMRISSSSDDDSDEESSESSENF